METYRNSNVQTIKRQISLLINNPVSGDAYRLVQICKMNQVNEANTRNDEPDSLLMSDYVSGNEMEDVKSKHDYGVKF